MIPQIPKKLNSDIDQVKNPRERLSLRGWVIVILALAGWVVVLTKSGNRAESELAGSYKERILFLEKQLTERDLKIILKDSIILDCTNKRVAESREGQAGFNRRKENVKDIGEQAQKIK